MNGIVLLARDFLDFRHGLGIALGQALVDAVQKLTFRLRLFLPGLFAVVLHRLYHAVRRQEGGVVHIHHRGEIAPDMGQLVQFLKAVGMLEFPAEGLHHPHAHDVFQIPVAAVVAPLIGEIVLAALLRAVRYQALDAHKGPGAGGKVNAVLGHGGHGHDCRAGIMGGGQHHLGLVADSFRHFVREGPHHGLGHVQLAKEPPRYAKNIHEFPVPILGLGIH